jgi:predicted nucleic acid-binding protein
LIVLDTSVISAFSEIRRFTLLKEILSRLKVKAIIPHTVEKELIFSEAVSALRNNGGWIDMEKAQDFERYLFILHEGEAGVIALAKEHAWIAALDDLDARKLAKKEHVKITGTLGLLKMGYELCPIKDKLELQKIITELRNTGFFMAPDIIKGILDTDKKSQAREIA